MANYPASLDTGVSLPNPTGAATQNNPDHAGLHTAENGAIIALEGKVGIGATTPAANTILFGTGAGTTAWQGLTSAQLAAVLSDETGSGSAVFATTPTLITPKVDTINEATTNNGVTVGGVNLKSGVVTGSGAGLTAGTVPGASVVASSLGAAQINFGGSGAGVWWEEVARTKLGVTGSVITLSTIPARTYLTIIVNVYGTGGTVGAVMTFNNDTAGNYAFRSSTNGGADATGVSQPNISLTGAATYPVLSFIANVTNVASVEKNVSGIRLGNFSGAGAATAPDRAEIMAKWANTVNQITRLDITNAGTGTFAVNSEVIVLGHN